MCDLNKTTTQNSTGVHLAPLGLVLGCISLITIVLNILVLYAVRTEKKLQTVGNLYIVSLSVADLIVGAVVMPLNIVYLLTPTWVLGRPICLFWLSMDYVASTASIFSLFILCIDRYRSVQQPLKYLKYRTKTRATVMISGAWLVSFLWIIPILGWHVFANGGERKVCEDVCETEFHKVTWFKVSTAIVNFYVPSLLMLWFYVKIFRAVQKHCQHRELINGSYRSFSENKITHSDKVQEEHNICLQKENLGLNTNVLKKSLVDPSCNVNINFPPSESVEAKLHRGSSDKASKALPRRNDRKVMKLSCFPLTIAQTQPGIEKVSRMYTSVDKHKQNEEVPCPGDPELSDTSEHTFAEVASCKNDSDPTLESNSGSEEKTNNKDFVGLGYLKNTWKRLRIHSKQHIQGLHMNRERKAAKQLGFIMAAFMLCWIPYFVVFMIIAVCRCEKFKLHMFTIWLGYVNSTFNPLIYPLCNENFKKIFKKILRISS
ncbi:histamine H1 receptor [Alligator mississippiensis]|uniref:histamine H1 receptor n=1 Tax=Alligator mississippiensis TaxID=8496 RepID=UPI0003D0DE1B|nr:histamine H1 receptor [Alligator mississippiensis]XP_059571937.1 histamine H1 receptor [Alligator mississippiensis]XP_059571938.1 histamine H1 receptor [Alligator mississippiensis]XP_059571939.1 histamine H1 receptor [Alligator mississippiensis]XP_059571940.1 histamine H1 receptor [Alligator mississippiensis]XP_059571941.1 histamine H1 receptor [Alligator mississippiensis]